ADQDQSARHAENARQERGRDHDRTYCQDHECGHGGNPLPPCFVEFFKTGKMSYPGLSINFFKGEKRPIPYPNGIRAFEAAARAGSFAAAAKELNVTPAAVSRMVRLLEQRLGLALFVREANRLALTPAGRSFQAGLTQIFDALANL